MGSRVDVSSYKTATTTTPYSSPLEPQSIGRGNENPSLWPDWARALSAEAKLQNRRDDRQGISDSGVRTPATWSRVDNKPALLFRGQVAHARYYSDGL